MARFKRAYPRSIYIRNAVPFTPTAAAATVSGAGNVKNRRPVPARARIGPQGLTAAGVASTNITPPPPLVASRPKPFVFRSPIRAKSRIGPLGAVNVGDGIAIKSPPVSALSDNLHSASENAALWNPAFNLGVPAFTTSGVSVTTSTVTAQYSRIQTGGTYNLTGGFLSHRLVNPGNQALVSLEIIMAELADTQFNNRLGFYLNNGSLSAIYQVSGTNHFAGTVAFSPANHVWFRIRENLGTTFWETSQNGLSWSAFFSIANQFRVTDMYVVGIDAGTYNVEATSTTVVVDDINIAASVSPVSSRQKPFVFRSPIRARARLGNGASSSDGAGYPAIYPSLGATGIYGLPRPVTFPISFRPFAATPQPYQRTAPQIRRPRPQLGQVGPLARAAGGGHAGIQTPQGLPSRPRPFVARAPAPARAVCGPRSRPQGGIASPVVTPLGSPSSPAPRPVIQHLPPHRAKVGPGTYLATGRPGVQTPLGFQSQPAPRPVIVHVPPARARLGLRGQAAGGVPSAVSTPLGSPSQPAPRPRIQHLPPHRAVTGNNGMPGDGIASSNVTPSGSPQYAFPTTVYLQRPVPARARLGQRGAVAAGITAAGIPVSAPQAYQRKPFVFRSPLPARARLGNNAQPGDGVASTNVTPQGKLGPPRPFVFRSPAPARARLGNNLQPGDGVASQNVTPQGSPSNPAPRPRIQYIPAHRAVWRGNASRVITPQGTTGPPRPFIFRSPLPARGRLGNNLACGSGYPSSIVTPQGSPSRPAPRPVIQHLPPHRAVWRGNASRNITLQGIAGPPRPFIFRSPAPARARLGNQETLAAGVTSAVSTPQGSPSRPAPRPVIQHLPPHRIVWRGLTSRVVTPSGILAPPRKVPIFPPKVTRARIGAGSVAGGVASSTVTPPFVTFATTYQRTAPQIKRPAPARALTGRGGCGSGIASRNVTPPLGSPSNPAARPVIQHLPAHRAVWRGLAVPPPLVTAYQRKPFIFRPPLPARARLGNNLQPGDGVASHISTLQGAAGAPRPFVFRSPARPRARVGNNLQPGDGLASQTVTPPPAPLYPLTQPITAHRLPPPPGRAAAITAIPVTVAIAPPATAYQQPVPQVRRPAPARARIGPGPAPAGGIASQIVTPPAAVVTAYQRPAPQIRRPGPARARLGPCGLIGAGAVSQNLAPLGTPQPTIPVVEFRPAPPSRARTGRGTVAGGIASQIVTPPAVIPLTAYQRSAPQVKRPAPARARLGPRGSIAGGIGSRVVTPLGSIPPARKVPQFPPKITRARIGRGTVAGGIASPIVTPLGALPALHRPLPPQAIRPAPHRALWRGLASSIVTPPPVPPVIVPQPTWTVAATTPLTVTVTPATPLTVTVAPAAAPGQQNILAQPEVTLNSELPPPIGQPS